MENEIECMDCGWQGAVNELLDGACPKCGSRDIEDIEQEEDEEAPGSSSGA